MTAVTGILTAAAAGFGLSRLLKIPVIPMLLVSGLVLRLIVPDMPLKYLESAVELGLVFLLFSMGIDLGPERFEKSGRTVLIIAVAQFSIIGVAGYFLARWLDFDIASSWMISFAMSASSTIAVVRHLRKQQQAFEPFGRLVTGVLLIQDILIILMITGISQIGHTSEEIGFGVLDAFLLIFASFLTQRYIVPVLLKKLIDEEETLLLSSLAILFVFTGLADAAGLPIVLGAFAAGFALSAFPVNGFVRGILSPLNDFFLVIFFVSLGAFITIPSWELLWKGLIFAGFILFVTPPLVAVIAEYSGVSSKASIESGLLLAQASELSLVAGLYALGENWISDELFSLIALLTVATMALTPFIATDQVALWLMHIRPSRRRRRLFTGKLRESIGYSNHIVMIGLGTSGRILLERLLSKGHQVVVIDADPVVIRALQAEGIVAVRGDSSDRSILRRANLREASFVICFTRRMADSRHVIKFVRGADTRVLVRVFDRQQADEILRDGAIPIVTADCAFEHFMEWFDGFPART